MRKLLTIFTVLIVALSVIGYLLKPTPQWCYQQGMNILDNTSVPSLLRYKKSNLFFRVAIYLDRKYIPPYYDLIRNYLSLAYMGTDDQNKDVYSPAGLAIAKKWLDEVAMLAPHTAELHFCRAQYIFDSKRFDEAISEMQTAISMDPENGRYYFEIGKILFEQYLETNDRHYASRAIQELKRSLNYDMKKRFRAAVFDYIGMAYDLAFHKKEIALDYYVMSQHADPTDRISRMHYWQIVDKVEQNSAAREKRKQNYASAVEEFAQSNNMKALCATAKQYLEYCDYHEAETVFKQVIEKQPRNYEAINMLGQVYLEEGELDQALAQFNKAVAINKHYGNAYVGIAYIRFLRHDNRGSIEANLKCVANDPKNKLGNFNLAIDYYREGDMENAKKYFQKCLEIDPRSDVANYWLGCIYHISKDITTAGMYFQKAADLDTTIGDCYFQLGNIYIKEQSYAQAIPFFVKAMDISPNPLTANDLAWCYVCLTRNQEEAVKLAEYAVSGSPNNHFYLDTLNKAYINLGEKYKKEKNWLKAWRCYRQAKKTIKQD